MQHRVPLMIELTNLLKLWEILRNDHLVNLLKSWERLGPMNPPSENHCFKTPQYYHFYNIKSSS